MFRYVPVWAVRRVSVYEMVSHDGFLQPVIHHGEVILAGYNEYFVPYKTDGSLSNRRFRASEYEYFRTKEECLLYAMTNRENEIKKFYERQIRMGEEYFGDLYRNDPAFKALVDAE